MTIPSGLRSCFSPDALIVLLPVLDDLAAIAQRTRKSVKFLPQAVRSIADPETIEVAIDEVLLH